MGGTNPKQVGLGSQLSTIDTIDTQGSLQTTGRVLDLGIQGDGYFQVQKDGTTYYTRAGNFYFDKDGNLVTGSGEFVLDTNNKKITIPINDVESLSIGQDGVISYVEGGTLKTGPQIAVVRFKNNGD